MATRKSEMKKANEAASRGNLNSGTPLLTGVAIEIQYTCPGCFPTPSDPVVHPGDVVVMSAINTRVVITFQNNKTPFQSKARAIVIQAGQRRAEVVGDVPHEAYRYGLKCTPCSDVGPIAPPSMIVE
jgi:hypothetical protein